MVPSTFIFLEFNIHEINYAIFQGWLVMNSIQIWNFKGLLMNLFEIIVSEDVFNTSTMDKKHSI